MRRSLRPGTLLGSAAIVALVLAACNPQGGATNPTSAPGGSGAAAAVSLQVKQGSMGTYLTDAAGKSLYVRTTDPANGSGCNGGCVSAWPPLTVPAGQNAQAGSGVTGSLASFQRSDNGSTQVTINGKALYYFGGDTAPGQTNGQGLQGIWFLAGPDGSPVGAGGSMAPASSSGPAQSTGGGNGY